MNLIRQKFEQTAPLSDEDWMIFSSKLVRQTFPKKSLLLKTGQTEKFLSFMEEGIVRFFIPGDENDKTFEFAFPEDFVSGYDSFLLQAPSVYQIETLTETVLWRVSYEHLQEIYAETEIGNTIGRHASEDLFIKKSRRELSLLYETAGQRYLKLFKERVHVLQQIPLKYIASYIGVTPQALSRIRNRIS